MRNSMKQSQGVFGNYQISENRKMIEKQLKQSQEQNMGFGKILDTPQT